ncbi:hypothetical protein GPZ77_23500 [Streptomyces sp. QHH-9511]|uniref:hypothetical protein n=2 Tax=Streptomyces TaxID=1883 RepID=UPI001315FE97|nr:hypothetical protein [Streptomyces sp. QHH-9511]QGZ50943.1 hypothetical protein GPZ77_23500 [Streptomyces sp. QHH-9511]
MNGLSLYARSRALPMALAALLGTAAAAAWAAAWLQGRPDFDHTARVPVVVLGPLFAASVVGTSLYAPSDELDRTSALRWPLRRAAHVLALTALAGALLRLAVPGHPEAFGGPAIVRNTLGSVGVAAAAAAIVGARLSWLPVTVYLGSVYLTAPSAPGGAAAVWAWPMQPGPQVSAWAVAVGAFAAGTALLATRGARPVRQ